MAFSLKAPCGTSKLVGSQPSRIGLKVTTRPTRQAVRAVDDRPNWLPGSERPTYLNGSLPGDFGWDPLKLGENPDALKWYAQAELVHCRWAMLGVVGMFGPEVATKLGLSLPGAGYEWFNAGQAEFYAPLGVILAVEILLMGWVEVRRYQDILKPGSVNGDPLFTENKLPDSGVPGYPGGIFDPFNWAKGDFETLKLKEIKNGRLAMFATLGFFAQAITTGKGPIACLQEHLADPWANNVWTLEISRFVGN